MIAAEQLGHGDARLFFNATGICTPEPQRKLRERSTPSCWIQLWGRRAVTRHNRPVRTTKCLQLTSGACGNRTRDLRLAKPALSQLS